MTRPWESAVGSAPWESGQTLYARVLTFKRPAAEPASGAVAYQGVNEASETTIASGIRANVEISSSGRNSASGGLPGDSPGPIKWTIALPPNVAPTLPLIMERDVIYDDLGRRFQVSGYEPTAVGARIDCVRLMA